MPLNVVSLKGRLRAIEKAQAASTAKLTASECEDHDAAVERWEREFIAGRAGPFPTDSFHPWVNRATAESAFRFSACLTARMERIIGETDYLPGMTQDER